MKIGINHIVKVSQFNSFSGNRVNLIVKITGINIDSWTLGIQDLIDSVDCNTIDYDGIIIFPKTILGIYAHFYEMDIVKNFGNITENEFLEKYPEYLL